MSDLVMNILNNETIKNKKITLFQPLGWPVAGLTPRLLLVLASALAALASHVSSVVTLEMRLSGQS